MNFGYAFGRDKSSIQCAQGLIFQLWNKSAGFQILLHLQAKKTHELKVVHLSLRDLDGKLHNLTKKVMYANSPTFSRKT